jgi:hypothetical protein
VALAAGPLLLASLTSDPALVAGRRSRNSCPGCCSRCPPGVFVDRVDRRRLIVVVDDRSIFCAHYAHHDALFAPATEVLRRA